MVERSGENRDELLERHLYQLGPAGVNGRKMHVLFSFRPPIGLLLDIPTWRGQELEETLQKLVADVEPMRKMVGMQGEGIIVAL